MFHGWADGKLPIVCKPFKRYSHPLVSQPITFDEVTTMFHEFGHALHGLFSSVEYPYFSGTSVPRDFVEYPSQVNEMWATWLRGGLKTLRCTMKLGEIHARELAEKVLSTQTFNQGFAMTEYLAAYR